MFGRIDNETGILRNRTDGGDGPSGRVDSEETRRKKSISLTGRTISQATREKLRQNALGKTLSPEARMKLSQKLKGRKCSEEHIQKVRESKIGFRHTEEAKRKMSENSKGKKHTQEWKDKMAIISKSHAKPYRITFNDERVIEVKNIQDWGKENGYISGGLSRVKTGVRNKYKDIIKIEVIN